MFIYRGCPITAGANGLLNIGLINSFGHGALNEAYAAIDKHFDTAQNDERIVKPEPEPIPGDIPGPAILCNLCGDPIRLLNPHVPAPAPAVWYHLGPKPRGHIAVPCSVLRVGEVRPEPMIAPTRIEVGTAPAYKSVVELAAEHPNLREFIADMEQQLEQIRGYSVNVSADDRFIVAALPIAYDIIKDEPGQWDAEAYDWLARLALRIAKKCQHAKGKPE